MTPPLDEVMVIPLTKHEDLRGWVMEILRREHLEIKKPFGQIYITTANPGYVKGNHYHTRKTEWFFLLQGEGELLLEDPESREKKCLHLSQGIPQTIKVPPGVAHALHNTGTSPMLVVAYIDEPYDPEDPDTLPWKLR